MILCKTCSVPTDYGNGWIYCSYRLRWLKNGYNNCKGYNKGEHIDKVHTNTIPSKLFQLSEVNKP